MLMVWLYLSVVSVMQASFWLLVSLETLFLKARQPYVKIKTLLWSCMMALATPTAQTKSAGRAVGRRDHVPSWLKGRLFFQRLRYLQENRGCSQFSFSFLLGTIAVTANSSHEGHPCTFESKLVLAHFWFYRSYICFNHTSLVLKYVFSPHHLIYKMTWPTKPVLSYLMHERTWSGLERWRPKKGQWHLLKC